MDDFVKDFENDIMPYAESHYRVLAGRENHAIAGLSMGGAHTLNIAIPHAAKFAYIGVFSSGVFGLVRSPGMPEPSGPSFEEQHQAALDNIAVNKGIKLFWIATGKDDFVMPTTRATLELFKKHGYNPVFVESEGGHTWANWRDYLNAFATQLFQTPPATKPASKTAAAKTAQEPS
jgi:enterochelin esterase family protein